MKFYDGHAHVRTRYSQNLNSLEETEVCRARRMAYIEEYIGLHRSWLSAAVGTDADAGHEHEHGQGV